MEDIYYNWFVQRLFFCLEKKILPCLMVCALCVTVLVICCCKTNYHKISWLETTIISYCLRQFLWVRNSQSAEQGWLVTAPQCLGPKLEDLQARCWNHLKTDDSLT